MLPHENDHDIGAIQRWLKQQCIWVDLHQRLTFYFLLAAIFALGLVFALWRVTLPSPRILLIALTPDFLLVYPILAGLLGALAAYKNRHIWGWGLLGGLFFAIALILLAVLPRACGTCYRSSRSFTRMEDICPRCGSPKRSRYAYSTALARFGLTPM
jgi:signal transduction histidine kinase